MHKEDLQRLVVLQEDVLRGDNLLEVGQLGLRQRVAHAAAFGAIDQGDGSGHDAIRLALPVFRQLVPDQFTEGLGAVGQAALGDHHVERREQVGRKADAQPGEMGRVLVHGVSEGSQSRSYYEITKSYY